MLSPVETCRILALKFPKSFRKKEGNAFFITIKTYRSPGFCIQVLAPFEEIIPLEVYGLPAGTYTVDVNGVQATFDLEVDNI